MAWIIASKIANFGAPLPLDVQKLLKMARIPRLPDLLTTANLCCGVGSVLLASHGQLTLACWLVFAGAFFDVLDGYAARALGGGSALGAQLDSLADMVTFGVAPMFIVLNLPVDLLHSDLRATPDVPSGYAFRDVLLVGAFMAAIPICSAWRLARFNVDTRQTAGFLGLPTPSNAFFWASIPLIVSSTALINGPGMEPIRNAFLGFLSFRLGVPIILWIPVVLGALMLSSIPLPGLKFKSFGWAENQQQWRLIGASLVLLLSYGMLAVPMILLLYLLSPLWGKLFQKTP